MRDIYSTSLEPILEASHLHCFAFLQTRCWYRPVLPLYFVWGRFCAEDEATKEVIAHLIINYINIKEVGSSVEAVHVNIMAPNKSIISMTTSNTAAKQCMLFGRIIEFK